MSGLMHEIMQHLECSPSKLSFKTFVSSEPRYLICPSFVANARMTSFKASNDVLISAPSWRVDRLDESLSAPRSEPAKSIKLNRPFSTIFLRLDFESINDICNTACERLLSAFAEVSPVERLVEPRSMNSSTSSGDLTGYLSRPLIHISPLLFSRHFTSFLFSVLRSNSFPP